MIINVHAGHNPDGKIAYGAVGFIRESTEARTVKNLVINQLKSLGHTVYDCTEDNGTSQNDVLNKIVKKCNAHKVDLDVSIHFNAGGGQGTEVLIYGTNCGADQYAKNVLNSICALGFKNRGVKVRSDLYVLRATKAPAMLIECCFVDSQSDVINYDPTKMAQAIVKGITGKTVTTISNKTATATATAPKTNYLVKVTANKLNVRAGAGTNYDVVTTVKKDDVYTIVQTSGNWGKLKSELGWICLDYTVRC